MDKVDALLYDLGFENKDILIYKYILGNTPCSITDISRYTSIKRTTIYPHIEGLLQKGFIGKTLKGKRIYYIPEKPQNLLRNLDKQRESLRKGVDILEKMYCKKSSPIQVKKMNGQEEFITMYRNIQTSLNPVYSFFSPEKSMKYIPKCFAINIGDNGKHIYDIHDNNDWAHIRMKNKNILQKRKYRILPEGFEVPVDFMLWGGENTTIISFEKMHGITIKDKSMYDFFKNWHQFIWEEL